LRFATVLPREQIGCGGRTCVHQLHLPLYLNVWTYISKLQYATSTESLLIMVSGGGGGGVSFVRDCLPNRRLSLVVSCTFCAVS
jgi:hypothetical protein